MIQFLKKYPVTSMILGVTLLSFILQHVFYGVQATTSQAVYDAGGMFGLQVREDPSQLWRLISPIFVHIGWEHFLFNAYAIYIVGQLAEAIWGPWKFLALYLLSGIMGNVFTLFLTPTVVAAGASTSIFGVFAAIVIVGYYGRNSILQQIGQSYMIIIGINLIFNVVMPNVSLVGHVGGMVGGALAAAMIPTTIEPSMFMNWQRQLATTAYVATTLLMVVFSYVQ